MRCGPARRPAHTDTRDLGIAARQAVRQAAYGGTAGSIRRHCTPSAAGTWIESRDGRVASVQDVALTCVCGRCPDPHRLKRFCSQPLAGGAACPAADSSPPSMLTKMSAALQGHSGELGSRARRGWTSSVDKMTKGAGDSPLELVEIDLPRAVEIHLLQNHLHVLLARHLSASRSWPSTKHARSAPAGSAWGWPPCRAAAETPSPSRQN